MEAMKREATNGVGIRSLRSAPPNYAPLHDSSRFKMRIHFLYLIDKSVEIYGKGD